MERFRIQVFPNDGAFAGSSSRLLVLSRSDSLADVIVRAREALALPAAAQGEGEGALRTTDGAPLTDAAQLMPNDRLVLTKAPSAAVLQRPRGATKFASVFDKIRHEEQQVSTGRNTAGPVIVHVGYKIINVSEISTVEESVSMDFLLIATWHDRGLTREALAEVQDEHGHFDVDWEEGAWSPGLSIQNATELEEVMPSTLSSMADEAAAGRRLDLDDKSSEPVFDGEDGGGARVKWTCRYRGRLAVILDLIAFPFDRQELLVCIRPRNGTKKVLLRAWPDWRTVQGPACQVVGFRFVSHTMVEHTTQPRGSLHGACYSELHARLQYDRVAATAIWNIFMPMFAVVCLSWTSFGIEPTSIGDRLSVSLTMVLTAVALKYVVSEALPALSHLTWVDTFIVNGFINLFCCSVFQALAPNILGVTAETTDLDLLDDLRQADRVCFGACVVTWYGYCLYVAGCVWLQDRQRVESDMPLYVQQLAREHEKSRRPGSLVISKKRGGRVQPAQAGPEAAMLDATQPVEETVLPPLFSKEHAAKLERQKKKLRREAKNSEQGAVPTAGAAT